MADQNTRGFRKFMLDPKSSVMTYIADNIPPEHISHQQGSNGRLQNGAMNGQQPNVQDPNRLQQNQILSQNPQNQSQDAFMRPPLPNRPSQSNSQSSSPRPGYAQPVQSSQMPMNTPYIASNMSQADQGLSGYSGAQSQLPGSQSMSNLSLAQESMSHQGPQGQYSANQNGSPSTAMMGQGPPQPGARRRNSPQSAPRLYHRMALDFEITKKAFFLAKSQRNTQETASAAYELESSSRRIWGLRHEHSWEFEGYSEAGHEAVFAHWRAEYEMWADTVLDIQDGRILADAANASKYGNASAHRDAEGWDSQPGQARSGFQELNGGNRYPGPSSMPQEQTPTPYQPMLPQQQVVPQQQMPQLQTLSMDQPLPPAQSMQNNRPPQPMPPGGFAQNEPPAPLSDPSVPPQQSPQPPRMPMAQNPPPNMHPGPFTASPNMPYANETPNPPPQQPMPRPGQPPNQPQAPSNRPVRQYAQQGQGMPAAPNTQQQTYSLRTSMSPAQTTPLEQSQNVGVGMVMGTGPRPTASPRPGPQMQMQMSPSLQAGGHMSGNGGGRS